MPFLILLASFMRLRWGGPGNSTETLVYKVYKDGFLSMNYGVSASQSVILIVIVMVLTVLQFRYVERKVSYA